MTTNARRVCFDRQNTTSDLDELLNNQIICAMENHEKIKNIIENAIIDGITYKDEMLAIGRGYDLGSIAELCTRKIERALAETTHDAPAGVYFKIMGLPTFDELIERKVNELIEKYSHFKVV